MTRRADRQNPTFFTGEALVAQLQSINDQTGILEQTVPGTNVTWGTIMGNIEDQTDLVQFVNDLIQKALTGEIEVDLSKYALKTDLENLATKDEIPVVPTNVSAFFNDIGYLTEHQDISNLATKDEVKALEDKAVTYKDFEYQGQTRKTIELANYNSLSGLGTDGAGYNLAMISKWDVADFGSPGVHMNLNTKDIVTINDDQVVATTKNIEDAIAGIDVSTYATKEELNAKADKTELEAYALKADAVTHVELADYPTKEEMDIAVNAKADKTELANYALKTEVVMPDTLQAYATKSEMDIAVNAKADVTALDALETKVDGVKAVADNAVPYSLYDNRKFIQLANHDALSGVSTSGDGANLIMMSKWDKVDIGTSKYPCNLNAIDGVVTINDNKTIATTDLIPDVSNLATKQEVTDAVASKANAVDVYTKQEVDAKIASVYVYKGSVATQAELPQENNKVGDTWNALDTGHNYTWDGTQWDDLGGTVDLSAYLTSAVAAETYATKTELATKADITAIPTKVSDLTNDAGYLTEHQDISNLATKEQVQDVKELTPVMVQIPIRTKSTFNTVQDKATILGWFGCTQDSELKGLISRQQPMFLKYGISLSTNPHYYKMPIQYIAYESANQVKIVTIGLDTNNDVVSKYEILMNLDGTVIENGGNVKMTITALESAETIATLQETIAQLTSRIEALEQA